MTYFKQIKYGVLTFLVKENEAAQYSNDMMRRNTDR